MSKGRGGMAENYYDSERGASEYLLFHYGSPGLGLPPLLSGGL